MSSNLVARVRSLPIFVLALSLLATACTGTRGVARIVSPLGAVLLLLSGAYVVYYWLTTGRVLLG